MNEEPIMEQSRNEKFLSALKKTAELYRNITVICAIIVAGAIAVAALWNVFVGLAMGIAAVLLYMFMSKKALEKWLGISYKSTSGELTVTKIDAKHKEEIWIPSRLIGLDVTVIEKNAFSAEGSKLVKKLHLPATLKEIEEGAFDGCEALEELYFEGTDCEWKEIKNSEKLSSLKITFCDSSAYTFTKKAKKAKKIKTVPAEEKHTQEQINEENTIDTEGENR